MVGASRAVRANAQRVIGDPSHAGESGLASAAAAKRSRRGPIADPDAFIARPRKRRSRVDPPGTPSRRVSSRLSLEIPIRRCKHASAMRFFVDMVAKCTSQMRAVLSPVTMVRSPLVSALKNSKTRSNGHMKSARLLHRNCTGFIFVNILAIRVCWYDYVCDGDCGPFVKQPHNSDVLGNAARDRLTLSHIDKSVA
jgi:hypothetical protein